MKTNGMDGKRKRLLLVSTRIFWPADVGHKILLYNYCRGLYDQYHYDIYVCSFLEYGQAFSNEDKPYFIKKVFQARKPGVLEKPEISSDILLPGDTDGHFKAHYITADITGRGSKS